MVQAWFEAIHNWMIMLKGTNCMLQTLLAQATAASLITSTQLPHPGCQRTLSSVRSLRANEGACIWPGVQGTVLKGTTSEV